MFFFLLSKDYLCKPTDNSFGIEFVKFKIRDIDTNLVLFEVAKSDSPSNDYGDNGDGGGESDPVSEGRFVRYNFSPAFLRLKTIGAT